MKKKIIGIAIFVFAGLFAFTFANPKENLDEVKDNNSIKQDVPKSSEEKNTNVDEPIINNETINNDVFKPVVVATNFDLKKAKEDAIKELENYVNKDDYREEEQNKIDEIIDNAKNKINSSIGIDDINKIKEEAKKQLDDLKTDNEYCSEELEKAKKDAITELENYVDKNDYREKEQKEIDKIIDKAKEDINKATKIEDINSIKEKAEKEIDKLKTDKELTEELEKAKKDAISELENYVDKDDYREKEQEEIDKIIEKAKEEINNASEIDEVNSIKDDAKDKLDDLKTDDEYRSEELEKAKKDAISELENYVDKNDYREKEQEEIDEIIEKAKEEINNASEIEEVNSIKEKAEEELDKLKTDDEYRSEELEKAKKDSISELENYVDKNDYREKEQEEIAEIIETAKEEINNATKIEEINPIKEAAERELDKLKTNAEYSAEELEKAKKDAINELENYVDADNYREKEQQEIAEIIETAREDINNATSIEEVNAIKETAERELDKLNTDAYLTYLEQLEKAKKDAISELENYADKNAYREKEQQEIDKIIENAKEKINNATKIEEVNSIKEAAKREIDALKTDAYLTALELQKAKEDAINNLKAYRDSNLVDNYYDEGTKIINKAIPEINNANDINSVNTIYNNYLEQLKELKEMQDYQKSSKFDITFGQFETNGTCKREGLFGICLEYNKVMKPNATITKKDNIKVALIFPQINNVTIKYDGRTVDSPYLFWDGTDKEDITNVKHITVEYMILGDKIFCGSYVDTYEVKKDINGNYYAQLISNVKK